MSDFSIKYMTTDLRHCNFSPTRRRFIKTAAAASVIPFCSIPSVSDANPAVFLVLNFAMMALNSYTEPDGAMPAILQAQTKLLALTVSQLENIQHQLTEVTNYVANIKEDTQEAITLQYQSELRTEISAALHSYALLLESSKHDTEIWKTDFAVDELNRLKNIVHDRVGAIINANEKNSAPSNALIVPLAASMELACLSKLAIPEAYQKATLDKYVSWCDNLVSDDTNSILGYQNSAISMHDGIIANYEAEKGIAKAAGISNFKLGSEIKEGNPIPINCVALIDTYTNVYHEIVENDVLSLDTINRYGHYHAHQYGGQVTVRYKGITIKSVLDSDFDVYKLVLDTAGLHYGKSITNKAEPCRHRGTGANKQIRCPFVDSGDVPDLKTLCSRILRRPHRVNQESIEKIIKNEKIKTTDEDRIIINSMQSIVDRLNRERFRILYSQNAASTIYKTRARLLEHKAIME